MKIYVQVASKAQLNRDLDAGKTIMGLNYSMFGGGGSYTLNKDLPSGTTIALFEKYSMGNPIAKSWGTWDGKRVK